MSEYFFMPSIYLESIDQIQARELNYLIFLFDNDLQALGRPQNQVPE